MFLSYTAMLLGGAALLLIGGTLGAVAFAIAAYRSVDASLDFGRVEEVALPDDWSRGLP